MRISEVSLGSKPQVLLIPLFVSIFIIKGRANGQLQVSENKDADFSLSRVMDALGRQRAPTSGAERKPGQGPWGPQPSPCRAA